MYCTWLPEAFICCLTWLALHLFIVMKHLLQQFFFSSTFPLAYSLGNVSGWEYEGVGVRAYKLLSQMDIYLGGRSNVLTCAVTACSGRKKKTERSQKKAGRERERLAVQIKHGWQRAIAETDDSSLQVKVLLIVFTSVLKYPQHPPAQGPASSVSSCTCQPDLPDWGPSSLCYWNNVCPSWLS